LEGSQTIPKRSFFNDYIAYCEKMSPPRYDRCNDIKLGLYLKKVVGLNEGGKVSINGARLNTYRTKPLEEMLKMFDEHYEYQ